MKLAEIKSLITERRFLEAQTAVEELIAQNSENPESQYLLGLILYTRGQLAQAVSAFKESLRINPNYIDAALSLSILLNDTGHYSEAKQLFEQAERSLAANPQAFTHSMQMNAELSRQHFETGKLYKQVRRLEEASIEFQKATFLDPENVEACSALIQCFLDRNLTNEAKVELQKLIQKYPLQAEYKVQMALFHFRTGNFIDGQIELQQALQQEPNNSRAKMYLEFSQAANQTTI